MTGSTADEPSRAAHRAVLDHLLGLVAASPLGDTLVLRGSMVMPAWVGSEAREPADLDWIVPRPLLVPVDRRDPYPYVDGLEVVQQWPEAADGAGRYEIWEFEEFDTRGLHPVVPPEELHWVPEAEPESCSPHQTLLQLVRADPEAAPGVLLDPEAARTDGTWGYAYDDTPGIRLVVPWEARGLPPGKVQLDFAIDERLPELPVLTAIPRGDGAGRTVVRTASRELSLAWKLLWLRADSADGGRARGKDLYDAVLLAEAAQAEAARLTPRLLHDVFRRDREQGHTASTDTALPDFVLPPSPTAPVTAPWSMSVDRKVDWEGFRAEYPWVRGTAEEWLERLRRALEAVVVEAVMPDTDRPHGSLPGDARTK